VKLEALLRAHGFMKVERPPLLWDVDCEDRPFVHLLGEMIVLGLGRGTDLADLVLNVSNVTVEPEAAGEVPAGDFVAVSVHGAGDWAPEGSWVPGEDGPGLLSDLTAVLSDAGCRYAYTRVLGAGEGSVTAFLPRLA
jgi:hypothetical protein